MDYLTEHFTSSVCSTKCPCAESRNELDDVKPDYNMTYTGLEALPTELRIEIALLAERNVRKKIISLSKSMFVLTRKHKALQQAHLKKKRDELSQYII